jgi:hypothetical protein
MVMIDGFAAAATDLQLMHRTTCQQFITVRATQVGEF